MDWEATPSEEVSGIEEIAAATDIHSFMCSIMVPYLGGRPVRRLRLLDWVVTAARGVSYVHYDAALSREVRVEPVKLYRARLRMFGRRNYSCFPLPGNSIRFVHNGLTYRTTAAQVRFFRDAHEYGILAYVRNNVADLAASMLAWSRDRAAARAARATESAVHSLAASDRFDEEHGAYYDSGDDSGGDCEEETVARDMADSAPCADDCPICLETCASAVVALACLHKFHRACIAMWPGPCPLCRSV
jgi:hypothetical protein